MNWRTPKLVRGEALLLCESGARQILWVIALIFVLFLPLEFGIFLIGEREGLSLGRIPLLVLVATLSLSMWFLPWLFTESAWKIAVTDRRLLHRPRGWGGELQEIAIADIETVRHDVAANATALRGGEQEISVDADLVPPDTLNNAIDQAKRKAA